MTATATSPWSVRRAAQRARFAQDAKIRENNDGEVIVGSVVVENVKNNRAELAKANADFMAEYLQRFSKAV